MYTPAPRDPKAISVRINLLSDTQTRPTPGMREAIARAEVGDEQIGDDPAVNELCERVADLLGKQAYVEAGRMKGDTGENLIGLLERRLDTVIYRAKFVATMFAARQFINHGHVKVNGRRVNISSFKVKVGDVVEVKESSKQLAVVLEANQLSERDVPDFLEVDHSKMTAKFNRIPHLSDVPFAVQMEPHLIVEFYSRC